MLMRYNSIDLNEVDEWLANDNWDLQQKIDGIRARLIVNGEIKVIGGRGEELVSSTAAPVVEKIKLLARDFTGFIELEGEIVDGKWYLFDMPRCSGWDFAEVEYDSPWRERWTALSREVFPLIQFSPENDWVRLSPTWTGTAQKRDAWKRIVEAGVEGGVFKHKDGKLVDGERVNHVLKAKITHTVDVFVIERGPGNGRNGQGNWVRLALYDNEGHEVEVGRCSTIGKPVANIGEVIEVKYLYTGAGGALVQPTHLRNRPDKEPEDCTTEQLRFVNKEILK